MVFTYLAWFPVMMILFLLAMIGIFDSQVMLSGAVVLGLLLLSLALWEQTRRP